MPAAGEGPLARSTELRAAAVASERLQSSAGVASGFRCALGLRQAGVVDGRGGLVAPLLHASLRQDCNRILRPSQVAIGQLEQRTDAEVRARGAVPFVNGLGLDIQVVSEVVRGLGFFGLILWIIHGTPF